MVSSRVRSSLDLPMIECAVWIAIRIRQNWTCGRRKRWKVIGNGRKRPAIVDLVSLARIPRSLVDPTVIRLIDHPQNTMKPGTVLDDPSSADMVRQDHTRASQAVGEASSRRHSSGTQMLPSVVGTRAATAVTSGALPSLTTTTATGLLPMIRVTGLIVKEGPDPLTHLVKIAAGSSLTRSNLVGDTAELGIVVSMDRAAVMSSR